MNLLWFVGPAVLAAVLSFVLTPVARRLARTVGAVDEPAARKVHGDPMPRLGGLAVLGSFAVVLAAVKAGWLAAVVDLPPALWKGMTLGVIPVVAISFLDDVRGVRARWKALVHVGAALIAVTSGVVLNPEIHFMGNPFHIGVAAIPLSIVWIVGVTNAFNLVDGLDGLSAGLALISSLSLSGVFLLAGERAVAGAVLVLAGALVGFLPYNLYPAKIFLGDTGATSIGFVLACFALKGGSTLSAGFATVLPILVLGLPVAETLISMARRIVHRVERRGSGVFEADRDHIHHRLLDLGIGHRQAVLLLYGVGLCCAVVGFVSLFLTSRQAFLLLSTLLLAAFIGLKRLGYDEFAILRKGLVLRVYDAPVVGTALFAVFLDLALVALSYYVARGLKTDGWTIRMPTPGSLTLVGLLALAWVGSCWAFGLYRGSWRLASLDDAVRCGAAVVVSTFVAWGLSPRLTDQRTSGTQLAVFGLVSLFLLCGSRISYRLLQERVWRASTEGRPVLIYGAGLAGVAAVRELRRNSSWGMRPVGFLDDETALQGKAVGGLPIVGTAADLEGLLSKGDVQALAISTAKIPEERVDQVRVFARRFSIPLYRFDIRFDEDTKTGARGGGEGAVVRPFPR